MPHNDCIVLTENTKEKSKPRLYNKQDNTKPNLEVQTLALDIQRERLLTLKLNQLL